MLCLLAFSLLGDKLKFSDYIRIASIEFENKMNFQSSPHGMETIELQMNLLKFKPDSSPSQSLLKWDGVSSMPTNLLVLGAKDSHWRQYRNSCAEKGGNETYEAVATLFKETTRVQGNIHSTWQSKKRHNTSFPQKTHTHTHTQHRCEWAALENDQIIIT